MCQQILFPKIVLFFIYFRGGNLLIIDLGHIKISSELQPNNINLEDATQMEMEEKLYDRFYMEFSEFQVLFCDSGKLLFSNHIDLLFLIFKEMFN